MESTYLIKHPSHALVVEAIQTLPGEIESINLELFADGVQFPEYPENEATTQGYLNTCKYQNIIPFSSKRIRWSFNVEEHIPKNTEAMQMYFSGGRTNRISFEISQDWQFKEIDKFKEILFPSLLKNNYKISSGEIIMSGHKTGSHQTEGYAPDLALKINYGEKGLGILVDDNYRTAKEEKPKYEKWFEDLKTKYKIRD